MATPLSLRPTTWEEQPLHSYFRACSPEQSWEITALSKIETPALLHQHLHTGKWKADDCACKLNKVIFDPEEGEKHPYSGTGVGSHGDRDETASGQ